VVTGLIKANIPTRMSFSVASKIDSRTVLDSMGAETLLGKGDMLQLANGSNTLQRLHGAFVGEEECSRVAEHLRAQGKPAYVPDIFKSGPAVVPGSKEAKNGAGAEGEEGDGEGEGLYEQAVEVIVREGKDWHSSGLDFQRPTPQWWYDDENLYGPNGLPVPMRLALPGAVNRGNAAQAVAAAVAMGADPAAAVAAVSDVDEVAGRYRTVRIGNHTARLLLAKNPAGWQEALSMVDKTAAGVVIAVNGQVPDGEDLSWLWDVRFERFGQTSVIAAGERGTDLAVRLGYAGVEHSLVHDTVKAIDSCPPGHVEVVANYTAFLQLQRALERHHA